MSNLVPFDACGYEDDGPALKSGGSSIRSKVIAVLVKSYHREKPKKTPILKFAKKQKRKSKIWHGYTLRNVRAVILSYLSSQTAEEISRYGPDRQTDG